jgi:hypothetical protein
MIGKEVLITGAGIVSKLSPLDPGQIHKRSVTLLRFLNKDVVEATDAIGHNRMTRSHRVIAKFRTAR